MTRLVAAGDDEGGAVAYTVDEKAGNYERDRMWDKLTCELRVASCELRVAMEWNGLARGGTKLKSFSSFFSPLERIFHVCSRPSVI